MGKIFKIAVLPGDGIGPEVMTEALRVLDAIERNQGVKFERTHANVGGAGIDLEGKAAALARGDPRAFVDPTGYRAYLARARGSIERELTSQGHTGGCARLVG